MATANEVLQMILQAKDEASSVFGKVGGSIVVLNQAIEITQKLFGLMETAIRPVIDLLIESAKAADESALAQSKLDTTLRSTGQFSAEYSNNLQQIAEQFQTLTGLSDELILDTERQLIAFGATRQQIVPLTRTVLDLSAGLSTDLGSATLLVSKALQGQTEVLGRYGIQVTEGTTAAQKLAEIQQQVNDKFGGQAIARMETMGGQLSLLRERYNGLQEKIGAAIGSNEAFQALLAEINMLISEATDFVTKNKDAMHSWVKEGILAAVDGLNLLVEASTTALQVFASLEKGGELIARSFIGPLVAVVNFIRGDFSAAFKNTTETLGEPLSKSLEQIVNRVTDFSVQIQSKVRDIRNAIATAKPGAGGAEQLQAAKNLQEINSQLIQQQGALNGLAGKAASILAINNAIAEQRELFRQGAISASEFTLRMSQLITQQSALQPATFNLSTGFKDLKDKINEIFKSGVAPSTDVIKNLVQESTNAQRTLRKEFGADIPDAMKKSADEVKNLIQTLAQESNVKLDDVLKEVPPILQAAKAQGDVFGTSMQAAKTQVEGINAQLQQANLLLQQINAQGGVRVTQ